MLLLGAGFFGSFYFISLFLQEVLGDSAVLAGVEFMPMAGAIVLGTQLSSRLVSRFGPRPLLVIGLVIASGGFGWFSLLSGSDTFASGVLGPSMVAAFGIGLAFMALATGSTAGVSRAQSGLASGLLNAGRQVGGAIGLGVLATVALERTKALLPASASHAGAHGGSLYATAQHSPAVANALSSGFGEAFLISAIVTAAAIPAALAVPRIRALAHSRAAAPRAETAAVGSEKE
jgi:predicted MFS family arabinose efflux permease